MTTTTTAPVAVADPAPAGAWNTPDPDRVDLGSVRVVHTRHWFRWTLSAILLFAIAQFAWSLFTNENYEWDVFAAYFFSEPVLIGIGLHAGCSPPSPRRSASFSAPCSPSAACRSRSC